MILRRYIIGAAAVAIMVFLMIRDARAAPDCMPGQYGVQYPGSIVNNGERSDDGWFAYQWCLGRFPDGRPGPAPTYKVCTHGECISWDKVGSIVGTLMAQAVNGVTKDKVFGDYYDANPPTWRCGFVWEKVSDIPVAAPGPQARVCAQLIKRMAADWPAAIAPPASTPPPAPAWVVAKNGTSVTRPAFPVVNGKRSYSSDGSVPVGSTCDCTTKLVEGSLTFCQVAAAHVAVCSPTN